VLTFAIYFGVLINWVALQILLTNWNW